MNINELLKKINIVDVIKQYITLQKKGQNYLGVCPFHNDNKPSLSISESKQIYKCFACNHSGNAIRFIMDFKNISFLKALEEIKNSFNLDLELNNQNENYEYFRMYELNKLISSWYHNFLFNNNNKFLIDYLNKRGIDKELIQKFQIGFAPSEKDLIYQLSTNKNNIRNLSKDNLNDVYSVKELSDNNIITILENGEIIDFFRNRLMFPIFDANSNIVAFSARTIKDEEIKYLNSPNSKIFKKSDILFNVNNLELSNNNVCLVEGFFDVLSLEKIGFKNSLATMGTAFNKNHIDLLKSKKISNVILALDQDAAGMGAEYKIALMLKKNNINIFHFKDININFNDFNDLLVQNEELLKEYTKNYEDYCLYLIKRIININSFSNDLNKQDFYQKVINVINELGSKFYLDEYVSLIKNIFNFSKEEILKSIKISNQLEDYSFDIPEDNKKEKNNLVNLLKLQESYKNLFLEFFKHSFYSKDLFNQYLKDVQIQSFNNISNELNKHIELKNISSTFMQVNNYIFEFYNSNLDKNSIINHNEDNYDLFINNSHSKWLDKLVNKDVYLSIKNNSLLFNEKSLFKNILNLRVLEIKIIIEIEYQNKLIEKGINDSSVILDDSFLTRIQKLHKELRKAEKDLSSYLKTKYKGVLCKK